MNLKHGKIGVIFKCKDCGMYREATRPIKKGENILKLVKEVEEFQKNYKKEIDE